MTRTFTLGELAYKSINQSLKREFLSIPGGVVFIWLRLFPGPIITGRCWPGVHRHRNSEVSVYRWERYALSLGERCFFNENYAIVPSRRGFGLKNRNFGRFFPGQRVQKPFLESGNQGCRIISDKSLERKHSHGCMDWDRSHPHRSG